MPFGRAAEAPGTIGGRREASRTDAVMQWLRGRGGGREAAGVPAATVNSRPAAVPDARPTEAPASVADGDRRPYARRLRSKTVGIKVPAHTPQAGACQRFHGEFTANLAHQSQSSGDTLPRDVLHANVECFPGCVEFVVTVFSADGPENGTHSDVGATIASALFDCLPPELCTGTVFLHDYAVGPRVYIDGREQGTGTVPLEVVETPDVRLVYPPCVPSGEEVNVEIRLGGVGRCAERGLRVVGSLGGNVFLEESAKGSGSVLRVRIPELQPGIVNFVLTCVGEDKISACKVAPLGVLPKAAADGGIALFSQLAGAACRPGSGSNQASALQQSRVVFSDGGVEEQVWEGFSAFLLEIEAMLGALERHREGDLGSLQGSAWELVLRNLVCHMAEFDAWDMISFLLERCLDANVEVDLGGFVPSLGALTCGAELKAQVLGAAARFSESPVPNLPVVGASEEGSGHPSAPPTTSVNGKGHEHYEQVPECVTRERQGTDRALECKFDPERVVSESRDGKQGMDDKRDTDIWDSDGWVMEGMAVTQGETTETELFANAGKEQVNDVDIMADRMDSGSSCQGVGSLSAVSGIAAAAAALVAQSNESSTSLQLKVAQHVASPADKDLGPNFEGRPAQGQQSRQAQTLIERFQQLSPSRWPGAVKRSAVPDGQRPLQLLAQSKVNSAAALELNSQDDDQRLSGSSLISDPSSLTCSDNTLGDCEIPPAKDKSLGVLRSMSSIVRKMLGMKSLPQGTGGMEKQQDGIPTVLMKGPRAQEQARAEPYSDHLSRSATAPRAF